MIAFLLTAFVTGFIIVYVVPKVNGWLGQVPQLSTIQNNKFAQLLIVGVVVIIGGWRTLWGLVLQRVRALTLSPSPNFHFHISSCCLASRYPTASKALKVILDILYQYVIMV